METTSETGSGTPGNLTANSFAPRVDWATGAGPQGVEATDLDGATAIEQTIKKMTSGAAGAEPASDNPLPADAAAVIPPGRGFLAAGEEVDVHFFGSYIDLM